MKKRIFVIFLAVLVAITNLTVCYADTLDTLTGVGIGGNVKLLLALFKEQHQGPLAVVEPGIFQGLLDEFGLTGIQESGEGIYRDLFHGYTPKS